MSFWENTFTVTGTGTPPPEPGHQRRQSLNEEVTEVMGQLGRFWGGFRKQSQDALEAARKEVGEIVTQAQKEIEKLSSTSETSPDPSSSRDITDSADDAASPSTSASASTSASVATLPEHPASPSAPTSTSPSSSTTLFSRLQTHLPPDLITTLRDNLPETIRNAPERLDLAQLRTTLQHVRVQDATARGEELFRGAGEFLRDAVRVVPPDAAAGAAGPSGSGTPLSGEETPRTEVKEAGPGAGAGPTGEARAIATRKEALLHALRTNGDILKVDPTDEQNSEALFRAWQEREALAQEGGIDGPSFAERKRAELAEDGGALKITLEGLVPSVLTESLFWTRYFFRLYQIDQDEERRKALLQGSADQEEDFSWEDEDEEGSSPTAATHPQLPPSSEAETKTAEPVHAPQHHLRAPSSQAATPGTLSPSQSEDSYDLVSSGPASTTGAKPKGQEEDDDDEDGEGEDDEEDESGDSDWE